MSDEVDGEDVFEFSLPEQSAEPAYEEPPVSIPSPSERAQMLRDAEDDVAFITNNPQRNINLPDWDAALRDADEV